jgi:hypothetical protein
MAPQKKNTKETKVPETKVTNTAEIVTPHVVNLEGGASKKVKKLKNLK